MAKKENQSRFNAYNKEVLKRFTEPKHYGEVKDADGVGEVGNMKCGDVMRVSFKLDNKKRIQDIRFQTFGCVSAIASSDALCELAKGKTLEEAKKIDNKAIVEKLHGLPAIKLHCSVLGAEALEAAIKNHEERKSGKKINVTKKDETCYECCD